MLRLWHVSFPQSRAICPLFFYHDFGAKEKKIALLKDLWETRRGRSRSERNQRQERSRARNTMDSQGEDARSIQLGPFRRAVMHLFCPYTLYSQVCSRFKGQLEVPSRPVSIARIVRNHISKNNVRLILAEKQFTSLRTYSDPLKGCREKKNSTHDKKKKKKKTRMFYFCCC